jgi:long-chain fatty acid transport protein
VPGAGRPFLKPSTIRFSKEKDAMTLVLRGRVMRALLALPLLCLPATVRASGFALETQGARAMGFADAFVAQKDDPSALAYNAAAIAFLKYKQVSIGGHYATASTDSTGLGPYPPERRLENSSQRLGPLPAIYYAQPVGEVFAFGLGLDSPFGMKNSWADPTTSTGRFVCMECEISTWRVKPTVALKLADRFSVGGGIDLLFSDASITRRMVASGSSSNTTDVAEAQVVGDRTAAVGWNLGVMASPTEMLTVGLSYRNKVVVTHNSVATFTQILTGDKTTDDAVAKALPPQQPAEIAFTYPGSVVGGVAWHGDRWLVEGDITYTLWSSLDNVQITHQDSALDYILRMDFASTWKAAVGVEYLVPGDAWAVRGGYSFETSPQPDSTLSPYYSDSTRNSLSVGGSHMRDNLRIDAAVRLIFRGSRTTDGANLYGYEATYSPKTSLAAGLSIAYRF